ncbi:MAG: HAMP domain-containing sensor histidine kinase [Polyangia bacterium]
MESGKVVTRIKRLRRSMSLTGAFVALSVGVILPVLLTTSVGIVTLVLAESAGAIAIGVLIVCFAVAAIAGAVAVIAFLGRRSRVARLQSDLIANVTHDLRTPLAAIRMYAQTLEMGRLADDPERQREVVETILRETEWLETSIERLLTWRAMAKDRDAPELSPSPLAPAVEEAVRHFRRMFPSGEVSLSVSIDSETPVRHDFDGISSLVLNLLINAYKYTGREKRIGVELADRDGEVEIAVTDNGIGIDERELGRIFDPFYRVDSRLRGKASGAGLGLAIVRHQARAHNGEVFVSSELKEGSRFMVRLPAARDAPGEEKHEPAKE